MFYHLIKSTKLCLASVYRFYDSAFMYLSYLDCVFYIINPVHTSREYQSKNSLVFPEVWLSTFIRGEMTRVSWNVPSSRLPGFCGYTQWGLQWLHNGMYTGSHPHQPCSRPTAIKQNILRKCSLLL